MSSAREIRHIVKTSLLVRSGATAGISFMLSCGDNWHLGVDAAVDPPRIVDAAPECDCPATEPPLAGRFVVVSNVRTIPPGSLTHRSFEFAVCPTGSQLISGSCVVDDANTRFNVSLEQWGFHEGAALGWNCAIRSYEPFPVSFRVSAICLKPAP